MNPKKFELKKVITTVFAGCVKATALILFLLLFVGRLNPARISDVMDTSASLVKTAFNFQSYVSNIIALDTGDNGSDELDNPFGDFGSADSEESFDDFYANFAAMVAESVENEEISDFDGDWTFDDSDDAPESKAEKIKVIKFREQWRSFSENHQEIADGLRFSRFASFLTFFSVMIALLGVYFVYGKNKIRKTGYVMVAAGAVLAAATMPLYNKAYLMVSSTMDMLDIKAIPPAGIRVFLAVIALVTVFALILLFTDNSTKNEKSEFVVTPFQYTYRILSLLLFVLMFIPTANPARISESISRNVSLFTSAFSYGTYTENLQRIIIRGWLPETVTRIAWIFSIFTCAGILICGAGSCMSVGNNKLKRYGHIALFVGASVSFVSLFGILYSYNMIRSSPNVDRVLPLEPGCITMYFILLVIIAVCAFISFVKTPAPEKDEVCHIDAPIQLFLMLLPFLILVFIFSYLPLWGWRYAFFDYKPGDVLSLDAWTGFKWFRAPFENAATRSDILRVLRNTLAMSGLGILGSWLPMAFAILLAEIKNVHARKVIQTLTTVPNFISWVLVYAIAFCIFGTEGFISNLMVKFGIWDKGKNMLMGSDGIWIKMWLWGVWKSLGWSAIMYIAAISGIDQQLYEAATVDGAGRLQKMWHITVPELLPTYVVLLILSISGILSNGMDQYLCFKNPTNKGPIEVLDLYVYQLSFGSTTNSNIPFSTVVSMFKSLVSVVLLFITNRISKVVRGSSIF